ncbi:DUF3531 family protein [Prochlorococcus marinus]|uniref:DUF3531 family protein n=1 Tax=Prochlorococcus marinus TaxID=1219 RepID=UPI0022B36FE3|nr:DUF3531 family protein [Prochlorococcus marinus]
MEVHFREIDPFNCWIWFHFSDLPSQGEKNYLNGILDSWYVIGHLGGFNSGNLQAHQAENDISWLNYDNSDEVSNLPALMHNLGQLEYQGEWARCWVDLGTSDAIALDVLINTMRQIDGDLIRFREIFVGGVNEDWEIDENPDALFIDND